MKSHVWSEFPDLVRYNLGTSPLLLLGLVMAFVCLAGVTSATSSFPPPTNVRVTNIPQLNNEEQTAISPVDSNIIISVWRDFRLGYRQIGIGRSTDGGQTWVDSLIHPSMQYINIINNFAFPATGNWQSDPTLTVDRFGNFYMSVLDFSPSANNDSSTITFYKTIDGGLSWTGPVPITPVFAPAFEDKQFITVDNTGGPTDGNVYMSWTRFPNPDRIVLVRSTDGAASFEDTVVVGPIQSSSGCGGAQIDAGQFSIPVVGANGDVHVFWQGIRLDSSGFCRSTVTIKHSVSTDAGLSFSIEDNIQQVSGWTLASGGINTYSQPVVDVDRTAGPFAGRMYLCFTNIGSEDFGRSDVDFMISDDNALTWSSRVQLNDDANSSLNDSFHPWLFVNEDGVVIVIYYDNRFDPPLFTNFDLVATYSFDGGLTFTSNHRITDVSSNPSFLLSSFANRQAPQFDFSEAFDPNDAPLLAPTSPQAGLIGEYIGLSANHDKVSATWTDSRDGNSEVYSSSWQIPLLEPKLILPDSGGFTEVSPRFDWATSWKNGSDQYRFEIALDPGFTVALATRILDTNFIDLDFALAENEYFWRVKSFNLTTSDSSEYSLIRTLQVDLTPPSTPTLQAPTDGLVTMDPKPAFDWSDAVDAQSVVVYEIDFSTSASFVPKTTIVGLEASDFPPSDSLAEGIPTFWRVRALDAVGNEATSTTFSVTFQPACCLTPGDATHDGLFNIADVTFGIARIFSMGVAPVCQDEADANGDNLFNIADVTYGIARIFAMGPAPVCGTTGD